MSRTRCSLGTVIREIQRAILHKFGRLGQLFDKNRVVAHRENRFIFNINHIFPRTFFGSVRCQIPKGAQHKLHIIGGGGHYL